MRIVNGDGTIATTALLLIFVETPKRQVILLLMDTYENIFYVTNGRVSNG
ncbi:MAG: hypothetical protein WC974_09350 [Thermoplasmata archaeon]